MRTLALFAALLLLALQAQAEPLPENSEEAKDKDQSGDEDVAISFGGLSDSLLQQAALRKKAVCHCKQGSCGAKEHRQGTCVRPGKGKSTLCCH